MIRDIVSQMTEFIDQEVEVNLDTVERWRDEIIKKLDLGSLERKQNDGENHPYFEGQATQTFVGQDDEGCVYAGDEAGDVDTDDLEQMGLEYLALAHKARELHDAGVARTKELEDALKDRS